VCSFAACMVLITSTMTARAEVGAIPSSSACCMVSERSSNAVDALIVCKQEALKRNSPMTSCRRAAELAAERSRFQVQLSYCRGPLPSAIFSFRRTQTFHFQLGGVRSSSNSPRPLRLLGLWASGRVTFMPAMESEAQVSAPGLIVHPLPEGG
jgi:hypothetical protein